MYYAIDIFYLLLPLSSHSFFLFNRAEPSGCEWTAMFSSLHRFSPFRFHDFFNLFFAQFFRTREVRFALLDYLFWSPSTNVFVNKVFTISSPYMIVFRGA